MIPPSWSTTTVLPPTTPTVLCACAAIGALSAPATATAASNVFRMAYSFPLLERVMKQANASLAASFRAQAAAYAAFSEQFSWVPWNSVRGESVSYSGTASA